jgi:hypothetical protein
MLDLLLIWNPSIFSFFIFETSIQIDIMHSFGHDFNGLDQTV